MPLTGTDLDTLAYDIAELLDRFNYPLDPGEAAIRAALPAFIGQLAQSTGTSDHASNAAVAESSIDSAAGAV